MSALRSVELFAGAGGLALGCEAAGFDTQVMVEWNKWACDTVGQNQAAGYPLVQDWLVHEGDVRAFDWESVTEPVDLVSGGGHPASRSAWAASMALPMTCGTCSLRLRKSSRVSVHALSSSRT